MRGRIGRCSRSRRRSSSPRPSLSAARRLAVAVARGRHVPRRLGDSLELPGPTASTRPASSRRRRAGIYTNLLVRTLVGYDHVAGAAGRRSCPTWPRRVPAPTNGGRTYTFTLKRGIRFGPPVNREITSARHPLRDRAPRAAARTARQYALLLRR